VGVEISYSAGIASLILPLEVGIVELRAAALGDYPRRAVKMRKIRTLNERQGTRPDTNPNCRQKEKEEQGLA